MTALILIFLASVVIHFVYEGIIAPSLRADLRLRLFALRDSLRALKMGHRHELSDEVFCDLQSSINFAATRLNYIDVRLLHSARNAFEHDEKLREYAERRVAMFESCLLPELHQIRRQYFEIIDDAVMINGGGWFYYLIPFLAGWILKESVHGTLKKLFSLPDSEIDKLAAVDMVFSPA